MNTVEELLDNGIELYTAEMMLREYSGRIGTMNGIYEIKDINYDFTERGKDVTLQCTECGKVIHRMMISGRNKWSELIKSCPCQKEKKRERQKAEFEKLQKIKKASFEEKLDACVGMQFGNFVVTERNSDNGLTVRCKTCGYEKQISIKAFENKSESTMHCTKHFQSVKYDESYIGEKRNYLTVLGIERNPNSGTRMYICQCDCGKKKLVTPFHWDKGIVKSCGCMHGKLLSERVKKHGFSGMRIYHVWINMLDRCNNPKNSNYHNYGGRGISVCEEWIKPETFIEWAYANSYDENAPRGEYTIDRIDVNGNYEPSNCRWITIVEQNKNKRPGSEWKKRNGSFEYNGKMYLLVELCKMFNTSEAALKYRMDVLGMTLEEALETPKMTMGRPRKQVSNGR